ncbi:MAG: class II fructose-bisphosphate aldolase [Alicyclobacillus macrosporangiidus]|uniref:class II fructose-bisphosphate aldolase n=1 Tax=Alicyclobacillus macrosporangiidus TaxID=392015 RepID=UPI0026ED6B64|nr:class II fructose-bisphosphate aldolase [Alicyclobacillus macrosporangiidus]MCL6599774.1 class II fructose-bisphosphate aldolase [Alicyclobacillus macrosporangiidus]
MASEMQDQPGTGTGRGAGTETAGADLAPARFAPFGPMLRQAVAGGYAVAAFNVYDLATFRAAVAAARRRKAPVILALGERYFHLMRPRTAVALLQALLAEAAGSAGEGMADGAADGGARTPGSSLWRPAIGLHLDHAASPEHCLEAIEAGFSSVMIDASHLPFEENVRVTKAVVEAAHARGAGVEAELGGIAAGEASHEFSSGTEALTDPDQAAAFVAATGVDALAVSVGTVHGLYRGEPHIDLPRLAAIRARVDVPLVLHGGSGTPEDLLKAAIARGVAKVNVNTEISLAAVQRIAGTVAERPKAHLSELTVAAEGAAQEVMEAYIDRFLWPGPEACIGQTSDGRAAGPETLRERAGGPAAGGQVVER